MEIFIGALFGILFLFYRREKHSQIKKLQDELFSKDVSFSSTVRRLTEITAIHLAYIKQLEGFAQLSKEKVNELADLFSDKPLVSDNEHAGVIMFQILEDARRAVDKLDPESDIAKELRGLLK